jgi:hypothetical protein
MGDTTFNSNHMNSPNLASPFAMKKEELKFDSIEKRLLELIT